MKTIRHLSLINNIGITLATDCFGWFGAEFEMEEGSEYNESHAEAVVFFKNVWLDILFLV